MSKNIFAISALAATLFVAPAFAVDGTTLINQATVVAAGGFPYQINQPGSYKLSGNLLVPTNVTSGILINSNFVTLDLNGFMVFCNGCTGVVGIQSYGTDTAISNGKVIGFAGTGGFGISIAALHGIVDHVIATGNTFGISANNTVDVTIMNCTASGNDVGINAYGTATIQNNMVSRNRASGINIGSGLISGNTIDGNGYSGGFSDTNIAFGGGGNVSITNNLISNSLGYGIIVQFQAGSVVIGSNTIVGNPTAWSSLLVFSMNNNVCRGTGPNSTIC